MKIWENILINARDYANFYEQNKFKYKNSAIKTTWPGACKVKYSNCMAYVSYIMQGVGLYKPGQMVYCNSKGELVYKGTGTRSRVSKKFTKIKVNKTPTAYKAKLKPGDICFFKAHTCIFAGIDAKGKMIWWDAGKSATNTKKSGGTYTNIHRAQVFRGRPIKWILRAKEA